MEDVEQKSHRKRQSGRKAEKKKAKASKADERGKNVKAFTFKSAIRAARLTRRKLDVQAKTQHIPVVDRTPEEPPPICVAVVGPPKVGKSTLIQCLIKNYTKQSLTEIRGPVTIVSG